MRSFAGSRKIKYNSNNISTNTQKRAWQPAACRSGKINSVWEIGTPLPPCPTDPFAMKQQQNPLIRKLYVLRKRKYEALKLSKGRSGFAEWLNLIAGLTRLNGVSSNSFGVGTRVQPDRTLDDLRAPKSIDWRFWATKIFRGPEIREMFCQEGNSFEWANRRIRVAATWDDIKAWKAIKCLP